jgi:hypothetical protein
MSLPQEAIRFVNRLRKPKGRDEHICQRIVSTMQIADDNNTQETSVQIRRTAVTRWRPTACRNRNAVDPALSHGLWRLLRDVQFVTLVIFGSREHRITPE